MTPWCCGFPFKFSNYFRSYDAKLCALLDEYTQVLVVAAGSNQLQNIRYGLRGDSIVFMGKNSIMKRTVRIHAEKTGNNAILNLIPLFVGNVCLIFTKGDLKEVSEEVAKYKVEAPARVSLVAPIDVVVLPGNTGLDPSQKSFFQVLNIPTKINKGMVEIVTPVQLIKKGDKVGLSEAALLAKLGIRPFSYGLVVLSVYDNGSVLNPEVLDLTEDDLLGSFAMGVSMVTSLSLALSYPTLAAAPHMFINGYKNLLAIAVETDYSFPLADKVKEYLEDPSKFAVAAADSGSGFVPAKEEEKKDEPEGEEDNDIGFTLFDDEEDNEEDDEIGSVFNPEVLDLTENDLLGRFAMGVSMVTSMSLALSYPTLSVAPHMFINGYKNLLAIAVETDYSFPLADKVKEYLEDPFKFAVAAADSSSGFAPAKEEEKKDELEEEEDNDIGFLFDYEEDDDIGFTLFDNKEGQNPEKVALGMGGCDFFRWCPDREGSTSSRYLIDELPLAELTHENLELKRENKELKRENKELIVFVERVRTENTNFSTKLEKVTTKNRALISENMAFKDQIYSLSDENLELKKKYEKRVNKDDSQFFQLKVALLLVIFVVIGCRMF